jgi:ribosomal protein S18 acetylase RimI-like enzyme
VTGPTVSFINNLSLMLVSAFGAMMYMAGGITLGGVSSFVLYSRKFSGPINEFANLIAELQSALAAAERVLTLCELPAEPAYDMIRMARPKAGLPEPGKLELAPLDRENSAAYLEIYNRCFITVPSAASYDQNSLEPLYGEDLAWLAKVNGQYAGVAEISKEGLEGIAVLPEYRGLGHDLALAVLQMVPSPVLRLKVASTNTRAITLYQRLGFIPECVEKRWFYL